MRRTQIVLVGLWLLSLAMPVLAQDAGTRWDQRYDTQRYLYGKEPVAFLRERVEQLGQGKALVLAAGEGRNAIFLAQQGFEVVAVDISAKGLEKGRALAKERGVTVQTEAASLSDYDMGQEKYDLVTMFYYYQPDLFPRIMAALKPGGHFILQSFSSDQPATNRFGPRNPDYLIKPNALLAHFTAYRIRYYEDTVVELDEGMHQGPGAIVRLIAEKLDDTN